MSEDPNDVIRYTHWTVFSRTGVVPGASADEEVAELFDAVAKDDVVVRGLYDVSGTRANADLMVWSHAPAVEPIQAMLRGLRRTSLGPSLKLEWAAFGVHRPAEFNRGHAPEFMRGTPPAKYLCVYPFVRSYDWYVLDPKDRAEMLREHGMLGANHKTVLSNTVSAFALGDYEWLLALESPVLHDLVDMMRDLRSSKARLHVREEIPFYTGPMVDVTEAVELFR